MKLAANIFKAYDIRGIYGKELTLDAIGLIAKSISNLYDHVWVVGEDGKTTVRDYPGNYSQYRAMRSTEAQLQQAAQAEKKRLAQTSQEVEIKGDYSERLSYKEQLEFDALEQRITELEAERDKLQSTLLNEQDHVRMTELGEQLGKVTADIDAAEMRWLELSERA